VLIFIKNLERNILILEMFGWLSWLTITHSVNIKIQYFLLKQNIALEIVFFISYYRVVYLFKLKLIN